MKKISKGKGCPGLKLIDSHADMVNLNCPDIMIDLMKLFQLLRHEKEMSGN